MLNKRLITTGLLLTAASVYSAGQATRAFNIRVESERRPGEIVSYVKDEIAGQSLPFKISESGKGRVDIPVNATRFTVNYGGVKSRSIDIPKKKSLYTIVVKIEENTLGAAPAMVGVDYDHYKITVVLVEEPKI